MKIKGALTIHVKFKEARKLLVLNCLIILYAQILSGFENLDIQDLFLNIFILFSAAELSSIEREDDIFAQEFSDEESDYGDSDDEDN